LARRFTGYDAFLRRLDFCHALFPCIPWILSDHERKNHSKHREALSKLRSAGVQTGLETGPGVQTALRDRGSQPVGWPLKLLKRCGYVA
jgi:hypothetical protein